MSLHSSAILLGPLTFESMAACRSSSNRTRAAEWKTIDTSFTKISLSAVEMPRWGSETSPLMGTSLLRASGHSFLTLSNTWTVTDQSSSGGGMLKRERFYLGLNEVSQSVVHGLVGPRPDEEVEAPDVRAGPEQLLDERLADETGRPGYEYGLAHVKPGHLRELHVASTHSARLIDVVVRRRVFYTPAHGPPPPREKSPGKGKRKTGAIFGHCSAFTRISFFCLIHRVIYVYIWNWSQQNGRQQRATRSKTSARSCWITTRSGASEICFIQLPGFPGAHFDRALKGVSYQLNGWGYARRRRTPESFHLFAQFSARPFAKVGPNCIMARKILLVAVSSVSVCARRKPRWLNYATDAQRVKSSIGQTTLNQYEKRTTNNRSLG